MYINSRDIIYPARTWFHVQKSSLEAKKNTAISFALLITVDSKINRKTDKLGVHQNKYLKRCKDIMFSNHICVLYIYYSCLRTGVSANADPHTKKLRTRVTHIWGNRRLQPNRSAMEGPLPGGTACMITVASVPGKYAFRLNWRSFILFTYDCRQVTRLEHPCTWIF